jgi:hypothetical protein
MGIVIFFGAILPGFFLIFAAMALLSAIKYRRQCEELQKAPVYRRDVPHQLD